MAKIQQVKCIDCGFLSLGEFEVNKVDRILLHCDGSAGCPPIDALICHKSLWVDEALSREGPENIFNFLKQKQPCEFYFKYHPGYSPEAHKELEQRHLDRRFKLKNNIIGLFIGSVFTQLINWLIK